MSTLKIPTAKIFEPLLQRSRYKGVFGGRGSGKSPFFAELLVETCQAERGTLAVCIREAQRTLANKFWPLNEPDAVSRRKRNHGGGQKFPGNAGQAASLAGTNLQQTKLCADRRVQESAD